MKEQKDLCFIDIEATDIKPFEILQFSAYICDPNTYEVKQTINQKFRSVAQPRQRIKNLLKIDEWKPNYESLEFINDTWAKKIHTLINDFHVVSYGDFDKKIIEELFKKFNVESNVDEMEDYFETFKTKWPIKKITPSLPKTCLLLGVDIDFAQMHDSFYDAWMLLEVYKLTKNKNKEDFENLVKPLEFMPKIGETQNFFYDYKTKTNNDFIIFIEELVTDLEEEKKHFILSAKFFDLSQLNVFNYKKPHKQFFVSTINLKKDSVKYKDDLSNFASLLENSTVITMGEIGFGRISLLLEIIKNWTKKEVCFKFMKITKLNKNMKTKEILERIKQVLEIVWSAKSLPLNNFANEFNYFIEKTKGKINEGNKN